MNCKCKCNRNIVKVEKVKTTTEAIYLFVPDMKLYNGYNLHFVITTNIDYPDKPLPVIVVINDNEFSMTTYGGNYVYSDQIRNRRLYSVKLTTDSLLAKNLKCNLYRTSFNFPYITKVATKEVK